MHSKTAGAVMKRPAAAGAAEKDTPSKKERRLEAAESTPIKLRDPLAGPFQASLNADMLQMQKSKSKGPKDASGFVVSAKDVASRFLPIGFKIPEEGVQIGWPHSAPCGFNEHGDPVEWKDVDCIKVIVGWCCKSSDCADSSIWEKDLQCPSCGRWLERDFKIVIPTASGRAS